jgi:hypothetical protein
VEFERSLTYHRASEEAVAWEDQRLTELPLVTQLTRQADVLYAVPIARGVSAGKRRLAVMANDDASE